MRFGQYMASVTSLRYASSARALSTLIVIAASGKYQRTEWFPAIAWSHSSPRRLGFCDITPLPTLNSCISCVIDLSTLGREVDWQYSDIASRGCSIWCRHARRVMFSRCLLAFVTCERETLKRMGVMSPLPTAPGGLSSRVCESQCEQIFGIEGRLTSEVNLRDMAGRS